MKVGGNGGQGNAHAAVVHDGGKDAHGHGGERKPLIVGVKSEGRDQDGLLSIYSGYDSIRRRRSGERSRR